MNGPGNAQATVKPEVAPAAPKVRVRDRIMRTANHLFYSRGIHAVGVDAIASGAGTNKMSFYRNFVSKDELVAQYLREAEAEAWQWWDSTVAAHAGDPRAQVEALFGLLMKKTCPVRARGCALANAAVEITEPDHPARPVIQRYKAEMRRRFRNLAREMHARDADVLGDSLMLLWEGSSLSRLTFASLQSPSQNAAKAARTLVTAHTTARTAKR
jgi:AcrR family transcriptional regulator